METKKMNDVIVIGAGIAGTFVARELARYELDILVIDQESDVANATTMANSAIVHAGYDAKPGSQKSFFNIKGNPMFDQVCEELDVPFKRIGSLVIGFDEEDRKTIDKMYKAGLKNHIPEMSIIEANHIKELEPNISDKVRVALFAKTAGIVSPFELAIALAENGIENGVKYQLETKVIGIEKQDSYYDVHTNRGDYQARNIINCAGVFADQISQMVGDTSYSIHPRKGEYYLLDKKAGKLFNHVIFQTPTDHGKGVLITPTVHGNVLVGPDSNFVGEKDDVSTEAMSLQEIRNVASRSSDKIPFNQVIRTFAGLRASSDIGDFVIGESKVAKGFINVGGFESPGLSAAPAVAKYVVEIMEGISGGLKEKVTFNPRRRPMVRFAELNLEEKQKCVEDDPNYGNIICRCEQVTEAEIIDCIHRNMGATTVKGVKKRTRPGMGRCQGGFCEPKVVEILARELNRPIEDVSYNGSKAYIVTEETKKQI
jgi:glycerol-3-phosphate dehydrogenase